MKNILIFKSKRFNEIPNTFFKTLIKRIHALDHDSFKSIICDESNYKEILSSNKIDIIFMPRGYGLNEFSSYPLSDSILKICFMDDLHYHNSDTKDKLHKMFSFSDIILLSYYQHFLSIKEFKPYHKKACLFPFSSISLNGDNEIIKKKILLSGRVSNSYPFRRLLSDYASNSDNIDTLSHPGYFGLSHNVIGSNYYKLISEYSAAIVTTAKVPIDYTLLKYFEIPSCNVIPIFQKTKYLKDFGFIGGVNYIEINNRNYKNILNMDYISKKDSIRSRAYDLISKNHTIEDRVSLFFKILDREGPINWSIK